MSKTANRTFSVLFYIDADIAPLGLYRKHLCNSRFTQASLLLVAIMSPAASSRRYLKLIL